MPAASFADEELVAYLDDALAPERRAEIDALLPGDPELEARLDRLDVDVGAIRSAFDHHLAAAPIDDLRRRLAAAGAVAGVRTRDRGWMRLAAALLVGAVLGVGGAHLFRGTSPAADWHAAVAEYQALYTTDTLKPLDSDPNLVRREVALAAAALGTSLTADALQVPDLQLKRAQILAFDQRPLVQFAYLDRAGTPIAFCATRNAPTAAPMRVTTMNGLAVAFWSKGGYGYMVIGGHQTAAIEAIAKVLEQRT
jgi:anti-sigma factor RsiW